MIIYYLGYQVIFSRWVADNRGYVYGDKLIMPESVVYKLIFACQVDDTTVQMAINYATQKINQFIDNYKP